MPSMFLLVVSFKTSTTFDNDAVAAAPTEAY
jgi:hypothetical protein